MKPHTDLFADKVFTKAIATLLLSESKLDAVDVNFIGSPLIGT